MVSFFGYDWIHLAARIVRHFVRYRAESSYHSLDRSKGESRDAHFSPKCSFPPAWPGKSTQGSDFMAVRGTIKLDEP